jgi:hypothetical protein
MLFQTTSSSRAIFGIEGALGNDTVDAESEVQLVWGSGSSPAPGTPVSSSDGTLVGTLVRVTAQASAYNQNFAATALVTGMVPGDDYWIGVAYRVVTIGNAQLSKCTITAFELLDPITP